MLFDDQFYKSAGEVLTLFLIPVGGGIPAGVVLAKNRGLEWPIIVALYFLSDCILACIFEPLMHLFIKAAKHSAMLTRWMDSYKKFLAKTGVKYGVGLKPFSLIALSFGVDPMTGRAAARAAGHGFFSGWTLAIFGDMGFFIIIMASTLWLDNVLGDGTWAAIIIMLAMIVVPILFKKCKAFFTAKSAP